MLGLTVTKTAFEPYLDGYSFEDFLSRLRYEHPDLGELLNWEVRRDADRFLIELNASSWEFENIELGGRGLAYNLAQKSAENRKIGMAGLLKCFSPTQSIPGPEFRILDVLGGDGTLARFCKSLGPQAPTMFTADISRLMIDACLAQGLPCIRQSATQSMFRDSALDGVLIAYGSHHLTMGERLLAVREAHRTLKPGGRLVLHDFESGGRSAKWFTDVVHPFSRTGHPHPHFTRDEMRDLLARAGFCNIQVFDMPDPFTLRGDSAEEARRNAVMHMYEMYDLVKIAANGFEFTPLLECLITETLGPISIRKDGAQHIAGIPRTALVAVGVKTADADRY